jgi:hypothetical protein
VRGLAVLGRRFGKLTASNGVVQALLEERRGAVTMFFQVRALRAVRVLAPRFGTLSESGAVGSEESGADGRSR